MDVSSILASSPSTTANSSHVTSGDSSLGMNDFFQLLAAELQYQDPTSPTDNNQMMLEMAQFSILEAVQNLTKSQNYVMASCVMGSSASYSTTNYDSISNKYVTTTNTGKIEAVDLTSSTPKCYVVSTGSDGKTSGAWVDYSSLTQIYAPDVANTVNSPSGSGSSSSSGNSNTSGSTTA